MQKFIWFHAASESLLKPRLFQNLVVIQLHLRTGPCLRPRAHRHLTFQIEGHQDCKRRESDAHAGPLTVLPHLCRGNAELCFQFEVSARSGNVSRKLVHLICGVLMRPWRPSHEEDLVHQRVFSSVSTRRGWARPSAHSVRHLQGVLSLGRTLFVPPFCFLLRMRYA